LYGDKSAKTRAGNSFKNVKNLLDVAILPGMLTGGTRHLCSPVHGVEPNNVVAVAAEL
jgi:hypothetical protein